jgi:hypothetical protein
MRIHCTIFLLILIPLATIGQTSNSFIGTWKVDVDKSIDRMDATSKSRFDSLTDTQRIKITEAFKGLKFVFNVGNTVVSNTIKDSETSIRNGTWTTEAATSTLIINSDGKVERFTYRFVSPIALILRTSGSKWWFNETYLFKN